MNEPTKKKAIVSKGGRFRTRGKVYEVRKESNDEVMTGALLKYGFISICVRLQIKDENGKYMGFHGAGYHRDFKTVKDAREFRDKLKEFIEVGSALYFLNEGI